MHRHGVDGVRHRTRWSAVVTALACTCITAVLAGPVGTAAAQPPDDGELVLPAIDVVVLVDESGSLDDAAVAEEREAARSVAQSVLAPGSTIAVVGFGSSNQPGQSPVDVVCPQTRIDSGAERDAVATCIERLRIRTEAEGNDTDHLAALRQSLDILDDGSDRAKIVFLMTDGRLDVGRSESYGRDLGDEQATRDARNAAALDELPDVLGRLDALGAQVWPLGFGAADPDQLGRFPIGTSCADGIPDPDSQVITDQAQLADAVLTAYSSATCVAVPPGLGPGPLPAGDTTTLTVDIPRIASDAAILVYKVDPRVSVEYVDPEGNTAGPGTGGSVYQFSGQATDTEALRVIDPVPGRWEVRLDSPPGVPEVQVRARVVYQGAVNARVSVTPPQPTAGQDVEVTMQLRTRREGVTSPEDLQGVSFSADLAVDGAPPLPAVSLTDGDGDGTFSGTLTVPGDAAGDLTFSGSVAGPGIGGDVQTFDTQVLDAPPELRGQLLLAPGAVSVAPGGELRGEITVTTTSGRAQRLHLEIVDPTPGAQLVAEPRIVEVPAEGTTQPFSVRVGDGTVLGGTQALLRLVTDDGPATVVTERALSFDVAAPPSWLERNLWWLSIVAAVLTAVAVLVALRIKAARDRRRLGPLRVHLRRAGRPVGDPLVARPRDFSLVFAVVPDEIVGAQLQYVPRGTPRGLAVYELRRRGAELALSTEDVQAEPLAFGDPRPVGGGLSIVVLAGATAEDGTVPTDEWGGSWTGDSWAGGPADATSGGGGDWSGGGAGWTGADGATRRDPVPGGAGPGTDRAGDGRAPAHDGWTDAPQWSDQGPDRSDGPTTARPVQAGPAPDPSWPAPAPRSGEDGWDDSWGSGSSSDQAWR